MRGKPAKKRIIAPDPKYGNVLLAKFINHVMQRGKKAVAQKIVYSALNLMVKNAVSAPVPVAAKTAAPVAVKTAKAGTSATVKEALVAPKASVVAPKTAKDAVKIFEEAVRNVAPQLEVRSRRVGGANYQVPLPVRGERQNALAFRWIIEAAKNKTGQPMHKKLATVLLEASQNTGDAMKKRDDVHRMAEANKAFAHFARFTN